MSAKLVPGLLAALVLASCPWAGTGSHTGESRTEVRAPIVRVVLRVAESHPPQYFADVTSALPNGCTRFARFSVRREGDGIFVEVFNTAPADRMVMCTMLYGEHESAVPLGSDFRPGARYTLDVNGTRQSFVAQ
jgi:hypothetical protein